MSVALAASRFVYFIAASRFFSYSSSIKSEYLKIGGSQTGLPSGLGPSDGGKRLTGCEVAISDLRSSQHKLQLLIEILFTGWNIVVIV